MKLFSKDLFQNKIPDEKLELEREHQRKLQDLKQANKEILEKAKQRKQAEIELRLKN